MKKIAIITITNSGLNFGNRLQNYALQHVLETYQASVQTIFSSKNIHNSLFLSWLRRLVKIMKSDGRQKYFSAFNKKHIKKAKQIRYEHINDHSFDRKYDAFITGSDQVWNPELHFNSEFEFLTFADPRKRFSYAASFGVPNISDKHEKAYAKRLGEMRTISVREEQGREIVKQLTGREAELHVDPTMLLDAEHYASIEEKPVQSVPEKYLLIYFLGKKQPEYVSFIEKAAEKLQLPVVELSENRGALFYDIGPQQFLYLLRHSNYICTDSFHGSIFSIIFRKNFTVFHRKKGEEDMRSRIDTLLVKTNLQNRLFGALNIDSSIQNISYEDIAKLLSWERAAAYNYLRGIVEQD